MTNEVGGGDGLTEKERLRAARIERETALSQRLDDALAFIERHGYRRCDIPACNCGSWHGGHAQERLHEIYEALGGCNGTTPVPEIERRIEREARLVALLKHSAMMMHRSHKDSGCAICVTLSAVIGDEP